MSIQRMTQHNNIPPEDIRNGIIRHEYYLWLKSFIDVSPDINHDKEYRLVLKKLHEKGFYSIVPNDDNRGEDGKLLRREFAEEYGNTYNSKYVLNEEDILNELNGPCSMLEVLIGLSKRCQELMSDSDDTYTLSRWFWEMMDNCGLSKLDDERYVDNGGTSEFDDIIDRVLGRTYDRNGKGGLFPLKYFTKNQRKQELIYQMNNYLLENYYIEDREYV